MKCTSNKIINTHWRLGFEQNFAEDLLNTVDSKINDLSNLSRMEIDPDSYGYFDRAEHAIGLGFVIIQNFITAMYVDYESNKATALEKGPAHSSGVSVAKVVNDAANYWKHNKEWSGDKGQNYRKRIETTFVCLGCSTSDDYPLSNIFTKICDSNQASFILLFKVILKWQKELQSNA